MMKVVMVDPGNYTPYYDYSLCKALGETGCQVQWITAPFIYDQIPRDGLDIRHSFSRSLNTLCLHRFFFQRLPVLRRSVRAAEYPLDWVHLLRELRTKPPDVLHMQWSAMPPVDWWMIRYLQQVGIPVVYTAHNLLPHEEKPWHSYLYSALYRVADQLIVHTENDRTGLLRDFDVAADKVAVIPYGAPLDFRAPCVETAVARRQLGLQPEQPVLLFFGLIRPYKGLACLLDTMPAIRRHFPNVALLIAGLPKGDFTPYKRQIAALGLTDAVVAHLRYIPHAEWQTYFSAADLVILPYIKAYQSAVLFTAYTFARPVVVTEVGGLPEAVEPGQSGYIVPPQEVSALADAICEGLSDPDHLREMGHYARHLAESRYGWSRIAQATLRVYRELISSRG